MNYVSSRIPNQMQTGGATANAMELQARYMAGEGPRGNLGEENGYARGGIVGLDRARAAGGNMPEAVAANAPMVPELPMNAAQQARDMIANRPAGGGIAAMAQPQMPQLPSQANDMARQRLSAIFGGDRMGRPSFAQTQAPH